MYKHDLSHIFSSYLLYLTSDADRSGGDDESAQGWGSWAWSYVPQILPYEEDYDPDGEDSEYDGEKRPPKKPQPSVMVLGLYVAQVNVVCKVSSMNRQMFTNTWLYGDLSIYFSFNYLANALSKLVPITGVV